MDPLHEINEWLGISDAMGSHPYSFGDKVAASAWTAGDLTTMRQCIDALRRYQEFEITIACACGAQIEKTIKLPGLRDVAEFLERVESHVGQDATPWFQ